jgi:hypothetical protein
LPWRWCVRPQVHAAPGPLSLMPKPIADHGAEAGGGNPDQDNPDAAGVLDLDDPGRRRASAPEHPAGWNPAGGHAGNTARSQPPRLRPTGLRTMRLPGAPLPPFRHHAERRWRSGRTRTLPPFCAAVGHAFLCVSRRA